MEAMRIAVEQVVLTAASDAVTSSSSIYRGSPDAAKRLPSRACRRWRGP